MAFTALLTSATNAILPERLSALIAVALGQPAKPQDVDNCLAGKNDRQHRNQQQQTHNDQQCRHGSAQEGCDHQSG